MEIELDGQTPLCCAHCGFHYLKHTMLDIYWREENAERGLIVHSERKKTFAVNDGFMRKNPSKYRSGFVVKFVCEGCNGTTALVVSQHKGETFLELRKAE